MRTVSIEDARTGLEEILDYAEATRQPVRIDGADGSAVLVSAAQWRSIQETLFLLAVPGMRDSILDGQLSSVDECSLAGLVIAATADLPANYVTAV